MKRLKNITINGKKYSISGDSVFIRYSAYADGTDFTEKLNEGQKYLGVATGQVAPTSKDAYDWLPMGYDQDEDDRISELETKMDNVSNALIGEKAGNSIIFDDISPLQGTLKLSVESKNLVPLEYTSANRGTSVTISGVTFTVNSDGSVTLNGKNNGNDNSSFFIYSDYNKPLVLKKGTYIGNNSKTDTAGLSLSGLIHEGTVYMSFSDPYTLEKDTAFRFLYFGVQKGNTREFNGETFYPMLMRGTVCEAYTEPVAAGTAVTLTCGEEEIPTAVGEIVEFGEGNFIEQGTTIFASDAGVAFYAEYNKDINKAFAELYQAFISLGGNV